MIVMAKSPLAVTVPLGALLGLIAGVGLWSWWYRTAAADAPANIVDFLVVAVPLACVVGGLGFGSVIGLLVGASAKALDTGIIDAGTQPWRLHAARRALEQGVPAEDAEVSRLAVSLAWATVRRPYYPRALRLLFLCLALLEGSMAGLCTLNGIPAGMLFFGSAAVLLFAMALFAVPAETRQRRGAERLLALHAADTMAAGIGSVGAARGGGALPVQ
ncbi:hypothetical protein [Streptomonospora litoralis]|nr:hypothetical protein [Streptomonospora litoralis]